MIKLSTMILSNATHRIAVILLPALSMILACTEVKKEDPTPAHAGISEVSWGNVYNKPVYLYTLTNKQGLRIKISNYGGTITSIRVPDRNGSVRDIVLGFDSLSGYLAKPPYFGATI